MSDYSAWLNYRPDRACWEFALLDYRGETTAIAKLGALEWTRGTRHGLLAETEDTVLRLDEPALRGMMQALVNEAYAKLGIAPTGFDAEINAQKRHLEDMRALVFKSGKPQR